MLHNISLRYLWIKNVFIVSLKDKNIWEILFGPLGSSSLTWNIPGCLELTTVRCEWDKSEHVWWWWRSHICQAKYLLTSWQKHLNSHQTEYSKLFLWILRYLELVLRRLWPTRENMRPARYWLEYAGNYPAYNWQGRTKKDCNADTQYVVDIT